MSEYYWHFASVDRDGVPRLGYNDGREIRVGETLTVEGKPVLCKHGLHASTQPLGALRYVRSSNLALCRVRLSGTVVHDNDKSVATQRTVVAMLSADETDALLREFSRWCALQVAHLWAMPDVVRRYLETGDESLRPAAQAAVGDTTWDDAWVTAGAAAVDTARAAFGLATRVTAWDAAWIAAGAALGRAARDAAWDAANDAQNAWLATAALERMGVTREEDSHE